ncbi:hypothetical protein [Niabella ginsengisoli]|uniref:Uncharacterized protein n=1 Tax=Niabella ginsengisoli TaxID=522298 RepID=A0ABS9SLD4_9BACT|nr:hypothetical protein [Niabella ginsengisoli]MCH5599197.1 hypothetical protein [Niabella ginsengisoli]
MKKQIALSSFMLMLTLWVSTVSAQNEKRYNIEMSFTHNGKTIKTALAAASYSLNREVSEIDSLYPQKNISTIQLHQLSSIRIY